LAIDPVDVVPVSHLPPLFTTVTRLRAF